MLNSRNLTARNKMVYLGPLSTTQPSSPGIQCCAPTCSHFLSFRLPSGKQRKYVSLLDRNKKRWQFHFRQECCQHLPQQYLFLHIGCPRVKCLSLSIFQELSTTGSIHTHTYSCFRPGYHQPNIVYFLVAHKYHKI